LKPLALEFDRSAVSPASLPEGLHPEIALLGRSNVGKSSLLNCLAGRKGLARTSNTPGRTQALNFYNSRNFVIVDLPGYGYAKVPESVRRNWRKLIEGYLVKRLSLSAAVLILDARRTPSELDLLMLQWLKRREIEYVVVVTKTDKMKRGELSRSLMTIGRELDLAGDCVVSFSAKTGLGKDRMIAWFLEQGKR